MKEKKPYVRRPDKFTQGAAFAAAYIATYHDQHEIAQELLDAIGLKAEQCKYLDEADKDTCFALLTR